jgi:signal-transduction protein with cAMP-binding, CBS, and nucleotidyltransferase domain
MSDRKIVRVRDVMKTDFDMIDGKLTVKDALDAMKHVETKTLLVDKRHDDDEYGIVLLSDIAKQVLAKDRSPERVNIYEIMSKPVISVPPDMDIRYCARMFEQFGLSRATVIEAGRVVGVVSFTDMVMKGFVD